MKFENTNKFNCWISIKCHRDSNHGQEKVSQIAWKQKILFWCEERVAAVSRTVGPDEYLTVLLSVSQILNSNSRRNSKRGVQNLRRNQPELSFKKKYEQKNDNDRRWRRITFLKKQNKNICTYLTNFEENFLWLQPFSTP